MKRRYVFSDAVPTGTAVGRGEVYDADKGYGFDAAAAVGEPSAFSVDVPEGNYTVTLTLGSSTEVASTVVKAEARRLLLGPVNTAPGEFVTRSFTINTRTPALPDGGHVAVRGREGSRTWDDKLTLEFLGEAPAVAAIEISSAPEALTVFVAGDSTVTDQLNEPFAGWGQMLPRFFGPGVAVANHAESGRSLRSFQAERRFDKILATLKPGDYVLLQFGHNDMKEKGEGIGAFASFADSLRAYIAAIRERGATPVLVTSMHRRRFTPAGKVQDTFGDYPPATRQVANEQEVALIDLHAMSERLYEALGVEGSKQAFVHYPANTFPGQTEALEDNSHHNAYGAYQLARCIVQGIRDLDLPLAEHLDATVPPYDPSQPDPPSEWRVPASPPAKVATPEGS